MTRLITHDCERCGRINEVDLDELDGMPLRNAIGDIIHRVPVEFDKPIVVECEHCHGPFVMHPGSDE